MPSGVRGYLVIIETERLLLKPFSLDLIRAALTNDNELYEKTGIISNCEWPEKDLQEVLEYFQSEIIKHGITGFGSWIITNKKNEIVGSAGFIGEPKNGVVEIGFGIIPSKRKNGFCREAVLSLINWAMDRNEVNRVIAHCERINKESINVLVNCKFRQMSIENDLIEWEYNGRYENAG